MCILHIWASNLRLHLKIIVDTFYTLGFLRIMWIHAPRNPRTLSMVSAQCLNFNVCHVPMFEARTCMCAVWVCVQCVCAVCVCVNAGFPYSYASLRSFYNYLFIVQLPTPFRDKSKLLPRLSRPQYPTAPHQQPRTPFGSRKGQQQQQQLLLLLLLLWQWHSGTVASRLGHSMAALATDVN